MAATAGHPPCVMCLAPADKQCSGCHAHWYCSRDCQRKHWRTHKSDCGKVQALRELTPKAMLEELETKERDFAKVSELVRQHRSQATCKTVWVTRSGDHLREDMEDARALPGIKEKLEAYDRNPDTFQQESINTLFSATEGVSRAKSLNYFEELKPVKERLAALAKLDEERGTSTRLACSAGSLEALAQATAAAMTEAAATGPEAEKVAAE